MIELTQGVRVNSLDWESPSFKKQQRDSYRRSLRYCKNLIGALANAARIGFALIIAAA